MRIVHDAICLNVCPGAALFFLYRPCQDILVVVVLIIPSLGPSHLTHLQHVILSAWLEQLWRMIAMWSLYM